MGVGETIDSFEAAQTLDELKTEFQFAIEQYGFSAYNFFDAGNAHQLEPYYFGTTGDDWEREYKSNNFVLHDPTLSFARRTNVGFRWGEVPLPVQLGKKKPSALKLIEAAQDHGFKEGYIFPYHFVDAQGRTHSTLVALFWKDKASELQSAMDTIRKHELNLIILYWIQRVLSVLSNKFKGSDNFSSLPSDFSQLTDRERELLTWAGRGRSVAETSEILKIGQETVKTHLVNAIQKLQSMNKTHAVAKAVHLGLIDI